MAALLAGELFSNSLRHSGAGAPGETVTVAPKTANEVIRVEVTDRSGPGVPKPRPVSVMRKTAGVPGQVTRYGCGPLSIGVGDGAVCGADHRCGRADSGRELAGW